MVVKVRKSLNGNFIVVRTIGDRVISKSFFKKRKDALRKARELKR